MDLSDDDARAKLLQQLMNDALIGTTAKTIAILHPKKLAIRELPPGNWAQIYVLYQSFCLSQDLDCASRATFYNVTKEWRRALRFRPFSKHSLCTTCDRLKSKMRHAKDFVAHASAADSLLGHLRMTWECRQAYWNARELSRSHHDVLCLIFDGYDKSKPVFPRWPHGQLPKHPTFERLNRTHVAVSAILAHGYGCFVFLSEEGCVAGGTFSSLAFIIVCLGHFLSFYQLAQKASKAGSASCIPLKPAGCRIVSPDGRQHEHYGCSTIIP